MRDKLMNKKDGFQSNERSNVKSYGRRGLETNLYSSELTSHTVSGYDTYREKTVKHEDDATVDKKSEVAPAGHIKYEGVHGSSLYIPTGSSVTIFAKEKTSAKGAVSKRTYRISGGSVESFVIGDGDKAKKFTPKWGIDSGRYLGYSDSGVNKYDNPKGLVSNGTVSESSWGETSGLYPTTDGNDLNGKYNPQNWDYTQSKELLKARAAITTIEERGSDLQTASPGKKGLAKTFSTWHMIENFPSTDDVILNDKDVKYFYLDSDPKAKHAGLNYSMYDVKMVKSYGPFYNIGGGDVKAGPTYVLFFKATLKKKK